MVAGVLSPMTTFTDGALFAIVGLVGILSAAMAYGWVGMILTTLPNVAGVEAPSSVQAALR
jgi:hypothetical protein